MKLPVRRSIALGAAACLLLAMGGPVARAETAAPSAPTQPSVGGELARFDAFLVQHPLIEARLQANPGLINNLAFQKNHPQLIDFLSTHPGIRAELAAQPRWFIHRELVRQASVRISPAQVAELDRLLDQHPNMERLLVQHPQLIRSAEFLQNHPELKGYIANHPDIDRAAESKPGRLMRREAVHEKIEKEKVKP